MSGKDIQAGRAAISVWLNDKNVKGQLGKLSRRLRGFGAGLTKIGGALAASSAIALAPLVSLAAEAEETNSKFQTVFGEMAGATESWAKKFAGDVGRSENEMKKFLSSTQDLLVPMGFADKEAQGLSKEISALAVDLASFNNVADADALNDLQAALTGSGEVMKKYGVIVSETAVKQKLLEQGIDPKAATEQQKAYARWQLILAGTTAAQGDAIKTSGSFTNQMKRLKAQVIDVATNIGSQLIPVLTPVVKFAGDAAQGVKRWADQNPLLVRTLVMVIGGAGVLGGVLSTLGIAIVGVGAAVSAAITLFGTLSTIFTTVLLPYLAPIAIGIGLITAALGLIVAPIVLAMHKSGELAAMFGRLVETAKQTFAGIQAALSAGNWGLAIQILWAGAKVAFYDGLDSIILGVKNAMPSILTFWKDLFLGIVELAKRGLKTVWQIMKNPFSAAELASSFGKQVSQIQLSGEGGVISGARKKAQAELDALTAKAKRLAEEAKAAEGGGQAPEGITEAPETKEEAPVVQPPPNASEMQEKASPKVEDTSTDSLWEDGPELEAPDTDIDSLISEIEGQLEKDSEGREDSNDDGMKGLMDSIYSLKDEIALLDGDSDSLRKLSWEVPEEYRGVDSQKEPSFDPEQAKSSVETAGAFNAFSAIRLGTGHSQESRYQNRSLSLFERMVEESRSTNRKLDRLRTPSFGTR
ncbi:phage tail tape measure protein [Rhodopirellula halodulae]|uniref:phage tail tape measure protein n=1 Tax=Rhodopirellula halodulae TaxID=2894198 RepID=UPI001E2FBFE6|nr:phage tail tape measure protein [Rhodopirellula sp. JC737]MCC9655280.1 phage tail tape measure protein [Rhodopirellula sp. JC737]